MLEAIRCFRNNFPSFSIYVVPVSIISSKVLSLVLSISPFLLQNMPRKRRNRNQPAPQPEDPLGKHVSHAEFRYVFTTLTQSFVYQNERPTIVPANPVANLAVGRI